jgi:hypothetical protein
MRSLLFIDPYLSMNFGMRQSAPSANNTKASRLSPAPAFAARYVPGGERSNKPDRHPSLVARNRRRSRQPAHILVPIIVDKDHDNDEFNPEP